MANTLDIIPFGLGMKALFNKEIDWTDGNVKVALTTSTFTPDQDTHDYFDDITNEVVATGYTAGGQALASPASDYTAGTNLLTLDADNLVWTITGSLTARNIIIYYDTGTPSTSALIAYGVFEVDASPADIVTTDGDLTLSWNASGLLTTTIT